MNQTESGRGTRITCPACNQEGQRITCTSGTKSEIIVYHPEKTFRTVCHVAGDKTMESQTETIEGEKRALHEADIVQAM